MDGINKKKTIDVAQVCKLAHLALPTEEQAAFQEQLENVLRTVSKLDELDLRDVEPTLYGHLNQNVFREDVHTPGLDLEDVMANAPTQIGNEFKLPKIME